MLAHLSAKNVPHPEIRFPVKFLSKIFNLSHLIFPFELKELQDLESAFIFLYSNYKYALYAPTTAKLLAYHAHDAVITSSDVQCTRQH